MSDAFHGPDPGAYALSNGVLHVAAAILLLVAFGRMTRRWGASAFVAAVFAVHPLHVESVAWISERKDVLAGCFWMATLAAYPRAVRTGSKTAWVTVHALGVLALLSKATAVALPITLLLLDVWPLARLASLRDLRARLFEKAPLLLAAAVVGLVTYLVQTDAGANSNAYTALPLRVVNAGRAYAIYAVQTLWPHDLSSFYPYPSDDVLRSGASLGALGLVATATVAALVGIRSQPLLAMGWLWFVATLVPMIGVVHVGSQAHADRYTYVAQTGLVAIVAFGVPDWIARHVAKENARRHARIACAVAAIVAIASLAVVARRQVAYWSDSITLFRHALDVDPADARSHRGLGVNLWAQGDRANGARHLEQAVRLRPAWGEAHLVWATALLDLGRLDEAEEELEQAAANGGDPGATWAAWGVLADRRGDARRAAEAYEQALVHAPDDWEVLNNLAWIRAASPDASLRDPERAVALAERAAAQKPDHAFVRGTLAAAYAAASRFDEAVVAQTRAIAMLRSAGDPTTAAQFGARLERYRAGRPAWDSAAPEGPDASE